MKQQHHHQTKVESGQDFFNKGKKKEKINYKRQDSICTNGWICNQNSTSFFKRKSPWNILQIKQSCCHFYAKSLSI